MREVSEALPEVRNSDRVRSFINEEEDTVFHVIETGFVHEKRKYIVVNENAYQDENFAKTQFVTKRELFTKFAIKL